MEQQIQYCTMSDGVRLAYSIIGQGSPIVRTSHWFAHLEHDLESPLYRHFMLDLARRHRLLRYDARGIGLSQRDNVEVTFERWIADLESVVDRAGFDKFILFGLSQGAAQAIAYAARHPDRVTHLIIFGGYARGPYHRENPEKEKQKIELACALIRNGWGGQDEAHRQFFTSQFIPDADKGLQHSLNEIQRVAATPAMAERFLLASTNVNVLDDLARIKAPTLVLHSTRDLRVPFALGQEIAAGIPGAKLVPLDTGNHLIVPGEPAHRVMSDAIADFLGDKRVRGALPGTSTFWQRLETSIAGVERNWIIKLVVILAALTGVAIFLLEMWRLLKR
jgi:pimeloyl-ACP methyl ester carboxylesterase